ncbi:hypothetical protein PPTG_24747, partial [Phytophthora nicotianae INRA-310]
MPPTSPKVQRYQSTSLLSRLFFSYADDTMQIGNTRQLDQDDLLELVDDSRSGVAYTSTTTTKISRSSELSYTDTGGNSYSVGWYL